MQGVIVSCAIVLWRCPFFSTGLIAGRHFGVGGPVAAGAPAGAEGDRAGLAGLHVVAGCWAKLRSARQVDLHSHRTDSRVRSVGYRSDELVRARIVVELQAYAAPLGIPVLGAADVRAALLPLGPLFPLGMALAAFSGVFALLLDGRLPHGVVPSAVGAACHDGEGQHDRDYCLPRNASHISYCLFLVGWKTLDGKTQETFAVYPDATVKFYPEPGLDAGSATAAPTPLSSYGPDRTSISADMQGINRGLQSSSRFSR